MASMGGNGILPRRAYALFAAFTFAFVPGAFAEEKAASPCDQPDIASFPLKSAPNFSYRYRYLRGASAEAPLVIFIPGGPGDPSIGTADPRGNDSYGLVLTDPRGSGCNESEAFKAADFTTEAMAGDIVELIQELKPKKYLLHGHSHGTAIATMVSAKIAALPIQPPVAVILEGVLGKYMKLQEDGEPLVAAWRQTFRKFDKGLQRKLTKKKLPYGLDENTYYAVMLNLTTVGEVQWMPYDLTELFALFAQMRSAESPPAPLAPLLKLAKDGSLPRNDKVYEAIWCNEFFDWRTDDLELEISKGLLRAKLPTNNCQLDRPHPFDSAAWQMRQRLFYFLGENDPATPASQGRYHFSHQENAPKAGYIVKNGGHLPLQIDLHHCKAQVYGAIFDGAEDLAPTLKACKARFSTL